MAASLALSQESDEGIAVEWPQDGEGDTQMLGDTPGAETVTPGVNPPKVADPPTGEKVSPVKPRVLFGKITSQELLAADKAGVAVPEQGSLAVLSPSADVKASPLHLVETKAQKRAKAKAKSQAKTDPVLPTQDSTVQQPKKKDWPKGKAKAKGQPLKRPAAAMKRPAAASTSANRIQDSTLLQLFPHQQ